MSNVATRVLCAALATCLVSLSSAWAGERETIAGGEDWDLTLYATTGKSRNGELPSGGMGLTLRPTGWANAGLAIDYTDGDDGRAGQAEGLGVVAAIDLLTAPGDVVTGAQTYLRLSYRAAPGMDLDGSGDGNLDQILAIRTGLRW